LTWKTSLAAVAIAIPVAAQPWPPAVNALPRQVTGYPGTELAGGRADRAPMTPESIWSSVARPRLPLRRLAADAPGRGSDSVDTNDKVTIKVLDRRGLTPANADVSYAILTALNGSDDYNLTVRNGTATGEVPAGRYSVLAYVVTPGGQKSLTAIYRPVVAVTGNTALTLDARQGRRIRLTTDNPQARAVNEGAMALIYQNVGGRQQMVAAFPSVGPGADQ
jgi:hypothetical protein